MDIEYATERVKIQCTSVKDATKLFGGNKTLVKSLFARINALQSAIVIKDIITLPTFRFHALKNKQNQNLEGYFAIDVKSRKEPWRIILQPLNNNKKPFEPCNIDEIARVVKIVEIKEVSKHYE
ncbi:hypothetical protein [Veillonella ratti]|uniref:hypothetical protein n=1 Tax=Veillonella ratti TaxID=103892 RepID=UPI000F8D2A94|nr:hypothetical protein [Veillonella ratti]